MKFIEMTGKTLMAVVNDGEIQPEQLAKLGVNDQTLIRINQQGDIELRRKSGWDVIGGLIGEFETRVKKKTGFEWA